jgi:hypothetical protein
MTWYDSTAFWTGAAAISTSVMALLTWRSIAVSQKQHHDARKQSEQHHQDGVRPLVLFHVSDGDPLDRSRLLSLDPPRSGDATRVYRIHCFLKNIGIGPALKVHLQLRFMGIKGYGISREFAPMKAGESMGDANHALAVRFLPQQDFNDADVQLSTGTSWELLLEYEDVFGNRFHTIHSKIPLQPWTVCGKGPAPLGVDPAVVNARLQAGGPGRDDGPVSPGLGP